MLIPKFAISKIFSKKPYISQKSCRKWTLDSRWRAESAVDFLVSLPVCGGVQAFQRLIAALVYWVSGRIRADSYYNLSTSCFLRLIFKAVSYNLFIFGML
jgi:hypothetical protein